MTELSICDLVQLNNIELPRQRIIGPLRVGICQDIIHCLYNYADLTNTRRAALILNLKILIIIKIIMS